MVAKKKLHAVEVVEEQQAAYGSSEDPLTNCLVFLCKHYDKTFSADALTSGLPLDDGCLTAQLFPRAASRGGLSARLSELKLDDIPKLLLPCVLILNDHRACVLLDIIELEGKGAVASVAWPETGDGFDQVALEKVQAQYSGFLFFVRKRYHFDARTPSIVSKAAGGHWFFDTLYKSSSLYRDALIASILINIFAVVMPLYVMNVYDRVVPNIATDTLFVLSTGK